MQKSTKYRELGWPCSVWLLKFEKMCSEQQTSSFSKLFTQIVSEFEIQIILFFQINHINCELRLFWLWGSLKNLGTLEVPWTEKYWEPLIYINMLSLLTYLHLSYIISIGFVDLYFHPAPMYYNKSYWIQRKNILNIVQ